MPGRTTSVAFLGNDADLNAVADRVAKKLQATASIGEDANAKIAASAEAAGLKFGKAYDEGTSKAAAALGKLSALGGSIGVPLTGSLDAVGKKLDESHAKAQKLTDTLASAGKLALEAGTVGFAGAAIEATKLAEKFQTSTASIQANAGITQKAATSIGNAFLDTAGKSTFSGQQMAQSYAAVAGQLRLTEGHALATAQATKVMAAASDLAEAKQIDLGTATSSLAGVMQAYRLNVSQAAGASDVLFNTSKVLGTNVDAVAGAMEKLHGRLGTLAPSMTNTGALMVELGEHGITGSRGVMLANTALQTMISPSKNVTAVLKDLGVNLFDSQGKFVGMQSAISQLQPKLAGLTQQQQLFVAQTLFGKSAGQAMQQVVMSGVPAYQQATAAVMKQNAVQAAAVAQSHTLHGEMETLRATVEDLATKFGGYLIPKLEATGTAIEDVIGWMGKHKAAAEALAGVIAGVLGAAITTFAYQKTTAFIGAVGDMGKALLGLGATSKVAAGEVDTAMGSTGVGLVLVGVGVAATELATHWSQVMSGLSSAAQTMEGLVQGALNNGVIPAINSVIGAIDKLIQAYNAIPLLPNIGTIGKVGNVNFTGGGGPSGPTAAQVNAATGATARALGTSGTLQNAPAFAGGSVAKSYTPTSFAVATLQQLGITPTAANIRDFTAWENQEGGNWKNQARFNPLNTTMAEPGAGNTGAQGNIKVYTSWAQGLAATVATLKNYSGILEALRTNASLPAFSSAVASSPWGTGPITAAGVTVPNNAIAGLMKGISSGHTRSTAAATSTIPAAVATMLATAQSLIGTKYTWGGGHNGWDPVAELKKIGVDCSGFVSQVLHAGGVSLPGPLTTSGLAANLQKGKGSMVTVYDRATGSAHDQHTIIDILGKYFEAGGNPKYNPSGGVSELTAKEAAGELAGGGFVAYHPTYSGKLATTKQLHALGISGVSGTGGQTVNIQNLVDAVKQGIAQSATAMLQKLSDAIQSGTAKTLSTTLGLSTSMQIGVPRTTFGTAGLTPQGWGQYTEPLSMALNQVIEKLGSGASIGRINSATGGLVSKGVAGSSQEKAFEAQVLNLLATGQKKLADQLVAAHKQAMQALGQELYAAQLEKDAQELATQTTALKDQGQMIQDATQAMSQSYQDQRTLMQDQTDAVVQHMTDLQTIFDDKMSGMVQAIQDAAQINTDQGAGIISAIQDQTQIQVDQIGEKGLFGLNLVTQKLQVNADQVKAFWDRTLANDQVELDTLKQQADIAENAQQINLDQVTAAQNQLVALAQQRYDTVVLQQDARKAAAQAHVDQQQLHFDTTLLGPAQIALDLNANSPKAVQSVFQSQLDKITGSVGKTMQGLNDALAKTDQSATSLINGAGVTLQNAQDNASITIQGAKSTLDAITQSYSQQIALAQSTYSGDQTSAGIAEAGAGSAVSISGAKAQTQFAGSGTTINIYGTNTNNASDVGEATSWALRTAVAGV